MIFRHQLKLLCHPVPISERIENLALWLRDRLLKQLFTMFEVIPKNDEDVKLCHNLHRGNCVHNKRGPSPNECVLSVYLEPRIICYTRIVLFKC